LKQNLWIMTQGCRYAPTPGLELANAFGVVYCGTGLNQIRIGCHLHRSDA
jgi:hypothetical protein